MVDSFMHRHRGLTPRGIVERQEDGKAHQRKEGKDHKQQQDHDEKQDKHADKGNSHHPSSSKDPATATAPANSAKKAPAQSTTASGGAKTPEPQPQPTTAPAPPPTPAAAAPVSSTSSTSEQPMPTSPGVPIDSGPRTPAPSELPAEFPHHNPSTTQIVEIVSACVGMLLLCLILAFLIMRRSRKKKEKLAKVRAWSNNYSDDSGSQGQQMFVRREDGYIVSVPESAVPAPQNHTPNWAPPQTQGHEGRSMPGMLSLQHPPPVFSHSNEHNRVPSNSSSNVKVGNERPQSPQGVPEGVHDTMSDQSCSYPQDLPYDLPSSKTVTFSPETTTLGWDLRKRQSEIKETLHSPSSPSYIYPDKCLSYYFKPDPTVSEKQGTLFSKIKDLEQTQTREALERHASKTVYVNRMPSQKRWQKKNSVSSVGTASLYSQESSRDTIIHMGGKHGRQDSHASVVSLMRKDHLPQPESWFENPRATNFSRLDRIHE